MINSVNEITSNQNKHFKRFKALNIKKNREIERLFLLEGQRYIDTALEQEIGFEALLFDVEMWHRLEDRIQKSYSEKTEVFIFPVQLFKEISQTEQSQGIIGVVNMPEKDPVSILEGIRVNKKNYNILMLDRVQDPGNLGTIIRTADAAGFDTLLLTKGTVDPYNSKVVRSTAGSILNVKIVEVDAVEESIQLLKTYGFNILSTALEGAREYNDLSNYTAFNCLVIGNEANGISEEILKHSDNRVKIPIIGKAESLNAAVAAGIMMYKLNSLYEKDE